VVDNPPLILYAILQWVASLQVCIQNQALVGMLVHSQKSWWHGICMSYWMSYLMSYWSHTHIEKTQICTHQACVVALSPTSTVCIIDKADNGLQGNSMVSGPCFIVQQEPKERFIVQPETMTQLESWSWVVWWTFPWRTTSSDSASRQPVAAMSAWAMHSWIQVSACSCMQLFLIKPNDHPIHMLFAESAPACSVNDRQ